MADVTCPECGAETEMLAVRRAADEFCSQCDYPLFWAPSSAPITTPGGNAQATLRRLPGAGGRRRVGSRICPECGELNALSETHCTRCEADLDPPPPPPPPAPEPEPEVFVPVPLEETPTSPWWVWWLLGGALSACVIVPIIYENLN
ncbi:hypothetical protein [Ilumatobacter coccineus]|uniref:hypothetical protein n=1 Tax=Ilumatobacter coccineus TaxID=467094 RepID=UPI00059C9696|nr:hypothetical protein [Ilumatobacter coccineus]